ncbi:type II secretion system F family protein [Pelagibius sp. 7325]|uniref:type II secretion system F family protein n=1 Tax=Pelagibius sp. 7325 TaxID=3131994 RepID=UPI0030EE5407
MSGGFPLTLGATQIEWLLIALPTLGMLVLFMLLFGGSPVEKQTRRRIDRIRRTNAPALTPQQAVSIRRADNESGIAVLDSLVRHLVPRPELLRLRLSSAGLKTTLAKYVLISFLLGLTTFGLLMFLKLVVPLVAVLTALGTAIMLPHLIVGFMVARRRNKFVAHFPEAIDLMVRGLRSGLPITESIRTAGAEIVDPVGIELRHVTDSVRLGAKLDEALWDCSRRINIQEFNFFTVALSIQSETGGNLAETLSNLSDVLRRRRQLKLKIKALSSEAKASAYIIGSLPFVMAILIYLVNADYIDDLWYDPRGPFLVGLGFLSFAMGIGVMYKMVKFEI